MDQLRHIACKFIVTFIKLPCMPISTSSKHVHHSNINTRLLCTSPQELINRKAYALFTCHRHLKIAILTKSHTPQVSCRHFSNFFSMLMKFQQTWVLPLLHTSTQDIYIVYNNKISIFQLITKINRFMMHRKSTFTSMYRFRLIMMKNLQKHRIIRHAMLNNIVQRRSFQFQLLSLICTMLEWPDMAIFLYMPIIMRELSICQIRGHKNCRE